MLVLSRTAALQAIATSVLGFIVSFVNDSPVITHQMQPYTPLPHAYDDNPTVFGKILRGELPALIIDETKTLLCFRDKNPRAPTHDLVIPKHRIASVFDLQASDIPLLMEMKEFGLKQLEKEQPESLAAHDYRLVFHVPPFNSVNHLHLHVVAPASQLSLFHGMIKYKGEGRNCVTIDLVIRRLQAGKSSVPFPKPSHTLTEFRRRIGLLS